MDGWKTSFLLGWPIFRCYVSFREGNVTVNIYQTGNFGKNPGDSKGAGFFWGETIGSTIRSKGRILPSRGVQDDVDHLHVVQNPERIYRAVWSPQYDANTPWKINGWKPSWNLQITHLERKMIFQTSKLSIL